MTEQSKHNETGESISEFITKLPDGLSDDAIGVWQIIPQGEFGFGLTGSELAEFLRGAIFALIDAGAVPVKHVPGSGYEWALQRQYGQTREEIAGAVVREWESVPHDSVSMIEHCPWFARPDPEYPKFVKLD